MQHINTVTTIVPVVGEDDIPRQLAKIAERDEDLRVRARQGYQLTHTATVAGPHFTTFVDTFTHDSGRE
ncbi:hypothetical protein QP157_21220 [Sphingomonas sp. LR61]|uniref:hypothetical protein n=1 Tax=Sphingomonas sp. LR61 TaxID=3050234 RepID=UPI002FE409F9